MKSVAELDTKIETVPGSALTQLIRNLKSLHARRVWWNMVLKDRHVVAATSMSEAAFSKGERTSGKAASG